MIASFKNTQHLTHATHLVRAQALATTLKAKLWDPIFGGFLLNSNEAQRSPVFCGGAIPKNYKDAATRAIAAGTATCPVGPIPAVPGVPQAGTLAPTPITGALPTCSFAPACPAQLLFIPFSPNPNFGQPRTMFNARQLQFGARFSF